MQMQEERSVCVVRGVVWRHERWVSRKIFEMREVRLALYIFSRAQGSRTPATKPKGAFPTNEKADRDSRCHIYQGITHHLLKM